jgi:hypothetical protein
MSGVVGRTYYDHGQPVTVLAQWTRPLPGDGSGVQWWFREPRNAPRNVLIRRACGGCAVRPFRGLRKRGSGDG